MKSFIKSAFSAHFSMLFMAFIIFATNDFTLDNMAINIIVSILLIGIYIILFYSDGFRITSIQIRNNQKITNPVIGCIILYLIPVALLIWGQISPDIFNKGIRLAFEIYMMPYKGLYHIFNSNMIVYIITLIPAPVMIILGHIHARMGIDVMKSAADKFEKMVYRSKDEM